MVLTDRWRRLAFFCNDHLPIIFNFAMQRVLAVAAISIPLLSLWYYRERSTRNQVEDESVEIVPETVVEETVPAILEGNDDQEEDDETATTILVQYSTGRMTVEVMDESRQYFSLQLLQNPYVKSAAALKYRLYCFFKTLNVVPSECNVRNPRHQYSFSLSYVLGLGNIHYTIRPR